MVKSMKLDVNKNLSLDEIKKSNQNFWKNLKLFKLHCAQIKTAHDQHLFDLECHVHEIENQWLQLIQAHQDAQKKIQNLNRQLSTIKENAIKLILSNFVFANQITIKNIDQFNLIQRNFFLQLHNPDCDIKYLMHLIYEINKLVCGQLLSEIDRLFDSPLINKTCEKYDFIATVERYNIIPKKQPWAIFFDKRFAYHLLRVKPVAMVIERIHKAANIFYSLENSKINFDELQKINPLFTGKNAGVCQREFSDYFSELFKIYSQHLLLLKEEYQRIENQTPFFLVRPFYKMTKNVIQVWQYELLAQQINIIHSMVQFLQNRLNDVNEWLVALNQLARVNQCLVKEYRDGLLKKLLAKNEELMQHYQLIREKIRTKIHYKLDKNKPQINTIKIGQEIQSKLIGLLASPVATVESFKAHQQSFVLTQEVGKDRSWFEYFSVGEKVPESLLSQLIMDIEKNSEIFLSQMHHVENLKNFLLKILVSKPEELSYHYNYVKQVLKVFLTLKDDHFLTKIKSTITQLCLPLQKHPTLQYCVSQIGTTISERLEQAKKVIVKTNQAIEKAKIILNGFCSVNAAVGRNLKDLMTYVQAHHITAVEQLPLDQIKAINLVSYFKPSKGIDFSFSTVIAQLLFLSHHYWLLNAYQKSEKNFFLLKEKNQFVDELALPLGLSDAPLENQSLLMRNIL